MSLIGHTKLREQLAGELPAVLLIEGAAGIGKSLVVREVADRVAKPAEQIIVGDNICTKTFTQEGHKKHDAECAVLTSSVSRHIVKTCQIKPRGVRAVVIDAGKATSDALNILLKLLEEPPIRTHFLLYASRPVLPTVSSRAVRLQALPLEDQEVVRLLVESGVPVERAVRASRWAVGRPGRAFEVEESLKYSGAVLQLLRAISENDRILLSNVSKSLRPLNEAEWGEARSRHGELRRAELTAQLLVTAVSEVRTSHYRLFTEKELDALRPLDSRALDRALRVLGTKARSDLKIRGAVEGLMHTQERTRR